MDIDSAVKRDMRRKATSEPPDEPPAYDTECAVCGKPLDKKPKMNGHQFCDSHDASDLRERDRDISDHTLEHLAGSQRENWD